MTTELPLHHDLFPQERRLLMRHGGISVTGFRFPGGVQALELDTGTARFVLLPFQGQQIWDAWVGDRRLTMQSVFDAPIPTREFRRTYGAFFVHCGATAMGSPQAGDTHLPHGELPNIPFDSATIRAGHGGGRDWVELSGVTHEREAFSHAYRFSPSLRFESGGTSVDARIEVQNIGGAAMPIMYLAHVNFRPVAGGKLVDGFVDAEGLWTKPALPPGTPAEVHAWHDAVAADYSLHRRMGDNDRVEPEFIATLRLPVEEDGWSYALQMLSDGSADYVSYRSAELPFGVRWLTRAPERQALGVILPATASPEGRAAAKAAGHLRYLEPGEIFSTHIRFGVLAPELARVLASQLQRKS